MTPPTDTRERILVVDDDPRIVRMITRYFEDEGYRVASAADGEALREAVRVAEPDMILLDIMLGRQEDGLALAREIRARSNVPIIMLTGRDDVVDRVVGLEIGADDYIVKPFHLREVLARVRTVLRRRHPPARPEAPPEDRVLRFDGWRLDLDRRQLQQPDGTEVALTTGEFDILAVLAGHPGRVFSRETLMERTRGRSLDAFDRAIDAQIARLRRKIETAGAAPSWIKSVRGIGYVFAAPRAPGGEM